MRRGAKSTGVLYAPACFRKAIVACMLVTLILLLAAPAPAQTGTDARAVFGELAAASRAAKNWIAEGTIVGTVKGRGINGYSASIFKSAREGPSRMRWEQTTTSETVSGIAAPPSGGTLMVCDGVDYWTVHPPATDISRDPVTVSPCRLEKGEFSGIADNLLSAIGIGRDHVAFGGVDTECDLIRAEYGIPTQLRTEGSGDSFTRTLCVDPVRKLVLRDREERGRASDVLSIETTSYTRYQRDAALPADFFRYPPSAWPVGK
jgi:hypothetical protein